MKTRHDVASPTAIHLRDWWAIVVRVFWRVLQDNLGLLAAGISFYAFLSIFPAIAAATPAEMRRSSVALVAEARRSSAGCAGGVE